MHKPGHFTQGAGRPAIQRRQFLHGVAAMPLHAEHRVHFKVLWLGSIGLHLHPMQVFFDSLSY